MLDFIKSFYADEDGAVTVDWVVLTAAVVGLGIAGVFAVSEGVGGLAQKIKTGVGTDVELGPTTLPSDP